MSGALAVALLLIGTGFVLIAAVGLLRLPDVLMRMHAATKAGTLGVGLILASAAVRQSDVGTIARAGVTILFLVLTAPVAAHLIARAAYRTLPALRDGLHVDELGAATERATPPHDARPGP